MSRLFLVIAAIGALFVAVTHLTAQATPGGWQDYDEAAFMMAQKKGRTIVVAVAATGGSDWDEQTAALEQLIAKPPASDTLFVKVDFDTHEAFVEAHGVAQHPAVLVFEGMDEVARSGDDGDPSMLRKADLSGL